MRPNPKNVSSIANDDPTEFGNSEAIIVKLAVKNAALPQASMTRITNANVMNIV
jgi:hypothetical protein